MSTGAKNKNESFTTIKLRPRDMTAAVEKSIAVNLRNASLGKKRRPQFMWGPPGIAKSSIVEQVCEKLNYLLVDIRLTQMEPTDLRGIPVPSDNGIETVVRWAIPELLPRAARGEKVAKIVDEFGHVYDGAVLLLDELPNAAPSVQAGSYQLVLDGRLGEYRMPSNVVAMAAGNRVDDKGGTFKMPTPLMNRFCHTELVHNHEDWQNYALNTTFDQTVVGFLSAFKDELFKFDPTSASRGFATPRSWEMVSDYLLEKTEVSENVLQALISGSVGDAIAVKFLAYRKNAAKLPPAEKILSGEIKKLNVDGEVSLCYALATSCCYAIRENYQNALTNGGSPAKARKEVTKNCDHFFQFMLDNFQKEMTVMGARTLLTTYRIRPNFDDMDCWEEFGDKYEKLVIAA